MIILIDAASELEFDILRDGACPYPEHAVGCFDSQEQGRIVASDLHERELFDASVLRVLWEVPLQRGDQR